MRIPERATWLVVPALLVVVAGIQYSQVVRHDQSTWSGAGMGMFATFSGDANREVVVTVTIDGDSFRALLLDDLHDRARGLLDLPSRGAVDALAEEVDARQWRVLDGERVVATADGSAPDAVEVVVLDLEVDRSGDEPALVTEVVRRTTLP